MGPGHRCHQQPPPCEGGGDIYHQGLVQVTGATSTHLKVVVEEEVQTTLLREMWMYIIRGWVQVTGAHQQSPEGCAGGAGGADHPAEGGGYMSIVRDRSRSQVHSSTHLKVVVEGQIVQTTLLREVGYVYHQE